MTKYFAKLGENFKMCLEGYLNLNKIHYPEEEFAKSIKVRVDNKKFERIDPILETQGWIMDTASNEAYPPYKREMINYSSYVLNSLIKPILPVISRSIVN